MRSRLFISLFLFSYIATYAGASGPARIYSLFSENGRYYFKATPYGQQPGNLGKVEVYDSYHKKLYTIEHYGGGYLSDDGRYFCALTYKVDRGGSDKEALVSIWRDGRPYKELQLRDLINDTSRMMWTTWIPPGIKPYASWRKTHFMHSDTLYVFTVENNTAVIDIREGVLVSLEDKKFILDRFKAKLPRQEGNRSDWPRMPSYKPLQLTDGREVKATIVKELKLKVAEEYNNQLTDVRFDIFVDRSGKASMEHWYPHDANNIAMEELKQRISGWISAHTFKTEVIPPECEKWLFEYFVYIEL